MGNKIRLKNAKSTDFFTSIFEPILANISSGFTFVFMRIKCSK